MEIVVNQADKGYRKKRAEKGLARGSARLIARHGGDAWRDMGTGL